ncbi:MAG TPA: hypothetical protein VGX94_15595 [Terriglobia bacterium]|nr:hypothetical protein [Terriglobia bacterium]
MADREFTGKASERFYECLLLLYPPGFRLFFGPDMAQVFRDAYPREAHGKGFRRYLAFWFWTFRDLVRSLFHEWGQTLLPAEGIDAFIQTLTDSTAVPLGIISIVLVQGYVYAVLTEFSQDVAWAASVSSNPGVSNTDIFVVAAIAACSLGMISAMAAWAIARNNRLNNPIIKLFLVP